MEFWDGEGAVFDWRTVERRKKKNKKSGEDGREVYRSRGYRNNASNENYRIATSKKPDVMPCYRHEKSRSVNPSIVVAVSHLLSGIGS